MNQLLKELDEKLRMLEPARARLLESLIREALEKVEQSQTEENPSGWPAGYFEETAGVLVGEDFERAPQGELPHRDDW